MARNKKKNSGEDPGLNLGSATAVAEPEAETPDPFEGTVYYRVIRAFTTQIEQPDGSQVRHDFEPSNEIAMKPEHAAEWLEAGFLVVRPEPESQPESEATPDTPEAPKAKKSDGLAPILIEVVAPSLNRPKEAQRLEQALAACAIPEGYELKINVQRETEPRSLPLIVNELVAQSEAEIVVVLADHIVPKPGMIEAIVKAFGMSEQFGMVGLNIVNMPPAPGVREYCFFALCRPFIEQFPERQVLCPDYHHFYGDTELGRYASAVDAFYFAEDAEIETHHVNNGLALQDDTWRASRSRKKEDVAIFEKRQAKGLLWGASFERVAS